MAGLLVDGGHRMPPVDTRRLSWCLLITVALGVACAAGAEETVLGDLEQAPANPEPVSEPVAWLQQYLRIDTTNPPGNEADAVEFLAGILRSEGIRYRTAESAPGRSNLWARLEGGDQPALLLLHHSDVVTADAEYWDVDPFAGELRDGYVYGRGALDMKSQGVVHLATFLALHRDDVPLNRDVIFMATADEEAGSAMGMGWMLENRPQAFADVGLALTEGGQATRVGERISLGIEVTQKVPLWLRLEATGPAGHGSTPKAASAMHGLVMALANISAHDFEPRIVPVVDNYFKKLAPNIPGQLGAAFSDVDTAIRDAEFRSRLHRMFPNLYALTQNTCAITRVAGSGKINVVAPVASAEIDCRLLPDQEPVRFLAELETVVADDSIWIHPLLSFRPSASDTDTPLYAAIEQVMADRFPGVEAVPTISTGFTDSHYLRERGIASYGFAPFVIPLEDVDGYHGNNERISAQNIDRGLEILLEIVTRVVNPASRQAPTGRRR